MQRPGGLQVGSAGVGGGLLQSLKLIVTALDGLQLARHLGFQGGQGRDLNVVFTRQVLEREKALLDPLQATCLELLVAG